MKKAFWIFISCILLFYAEAIMGNVFGNWLKPNFLLLFVISVNLVFGIRYGLWAAIVAGVFKDSFGVGLFGSHILAFVLSSYLLVFIKRTMIHLEAIYFKLALVFTICLLNIVILYCIQVLFVQVNFQEAAWLIIFAQLVTTTAVGPYCLDGFKKCVLELLK
jgi:rod shape-determining protein MreD